MLHHRKGAVKVDSESGAPLLIGHLVDVHAFWPDAVIDDQRIERPEALDGGVHQRSGVGGAGKIGPYRMAAVGAAFLLDPPRLRQRPNVIEDDTSAGTDEQAHRRCPDAARATGDEGNFSIECQCDVGWHGSRNLAHGLARG